MQALLPLPPHQADFAAHLHTSLCRSLCIKPFDRRALLRTCANRLKRLSPAAENLLEEEDVLDVFGATNGTAELPLESSIEPDAFARTPTAEVDGGRGLQQFALNIPPHIQQFSSGWTESNDEDISQAQVQLATQLPETLVAFDYGGSSTNSGNRSPSGPRHAQPSKLATKRQQQQQQRRHFDQQQRWQKDNTSMNESEPAAGSAGNTAELADAPPAAAAAAYGADESATPSGKFFSSRAALLAQLQQQQRQMQRQALLQKQRKHLYTYTLTESGEIIKIRRPGLKSPLLQTEFKLAKVKPSEDAIMPQGSSSSSSSGGGGGGSAEPSASEIIAPNGADGSSIVQKPVLLQNQQQQQLQQQWAALQDVEDVPTEVQLPATRHLSSSSSSSAGSGTVLSGSSSSSVPGSTGSTGSTVDDPSRGLTLSAFLYCCSRRKLLTLTWQLGLPPGALVFVSKVSQADMVLHVKPRTGKHHYQYDDYRKQAAAQGIPFIDLKNISLQELQLYLLPVYRLYAGELGPRDLLKRQKRRGWRRRYTTIKLPPA